MTIIEITRSLQLPHVACMFKPFLLFFLQRNFVCPTFVASTVVLLDVGVHFKKHLLFLLLFCWVYDSILITCQ
jgi:hypothetical protein